MQILREDGHTVIFKDLFLNTFLHDLTEDLGDLHLQLHDPCLGGLIKGSRFLIYEKGLFTLLINHPEV